MSGQQDKVEAAIVKRVTGASPDAIRAFGVGDNNPPPDSPLASDAWDKLVSELGILRPRAEELLAQAAKVPEVIPEELAPKVTDFIASLTTHAKAIEGARIAQKEPYLRATRLVDGLFGSLRDKIIDAKATVEGRLRATLKRKELREREAAEAKAKALRDEAEARQREADKKAREEREIADAARREAEALAERQRQEQERIDAEIAAAEQRRLEAEEKLAAGRRNAKRAVARAAAAEEEVKANAAEAERIANEERISAEIDQRRRDREARDAEGKAGEATKRTEAAGARVRKVQTAKPSMFAKTRGEYGATSNLQRYWTYANIDRDTLDLEALRQLIPMEDGLERAVAAFVAAGGRKLRGVDIFEDDKPRVT